MSSSGGRLSTHVLDTASGVPAVGVRVELMAGFGAGSKRLAALTTDAGGRCTFVEGAALEPGRYTLEFHIGDYFRARGLADAGRFLELVPVAFVIDEPNGRYHVPLLVSPWSYSTYRGS